MICAFQHVCLGHYKNGVTVLKAELSNLKTNNLTAIDTFISGYNQEIDKYFGKESKLPKISPKKVIRM